MVLGKVKFLKENIEHEHLYFSIASDATVSAL